MVLSGFSLGSSLSDRLLVVFPDVSHINEGSVSVRSWKPLSSAGMASRSIDMVGDSNTMGPGLLGLLASGGTKTVSNPLAFHFFLPGPWASISSVVEHDLYLFASFRPVEEKLFGEELVFLAATAVSAGLPAAVAAPSY